MNKQIGKVFSLLGIAGMYLLLATGAQAAKPAKIDICHAPPDNPANTQLIQVGANGGAADDHLSHGDWVVTAPMCDAIADNDCDGVPDDTALDDADCEAQLGAGAVCDMGQCVKPAPVFVGFATWNQRATSQSDAEQDALMDAACAAAFSGTTAASIDDIVEGIVGIPATNTSGRWLVGTCPNCEGAPYAPAVDGHARNCVTPGTAFPSTLPWPNETNCHTNIRSAVCVN